MLIILINQLVSIQSTVIMVLILVLCLKWFVQKCNGIFFTFSSPTIFFFKVDIWGVSCWDFQYVYTTYLKEFQTNNISMTRWPVTKTKTNYQHQEIGQYFLQNISIHTYLLTLSTYIISQKLTWLFYVEFSPSKIFFAY